jgi:hypothetical protein
MKLRFQLSGACTDVPASDFNTITVLLNGNLSAYQFIGSGAYPAIQATTPSPLYSGTSVSFWYDAEINGHTIDSYEWDFGNGATAQGQTSSSLYAFEGYTPLLL